MVVLLTAFSIVREREIGTLEQVMVTPIGRAEFILGKTLPFFLIGLLDVALIAAVGTLWFEIPFRGNLLVLLLGTVLFLLSVLGVGTWNGSPRCWPCRFRAWRLRSGPGSTRNSAASGFSSPASSAT